jgi:capsular polysaccharide biosynthesis protein
MTNGVRVRRLLRMCVPLLPQSADRKVAILASVGRRRLLPPWLRLLRSDTVHVVVDRVMPANALAGWAVTQHVAETPEEIEHLLHNIGTMDMVIDLRPAQIDRYNQTWARAAFYVREGGLYIVRPCNLRRSRIYPRLIVWAALVGGAPEAKLGKRTKRPDPRLDPNVTGSALLFPDGLVLVKKQDHFLFVRDEEVAILPRRERGLSLEVLAQLPAGTLHSKAQVTSHESARPVGVPSLEMPYPRLQLRHYHGRIQFSGQTLLLSGHSILPDSHRFYRMPVINHPLTPTWPTRPEFATVPRSAVPQEKLPGIYYLLDPQFTGHYGHLLTEVVPRLWGWEAAKRRFPELKVLTKVRPGRKTEPLLDQLLPLFGIDPTDLVYVNHPVEIESVITASAMWHNATPYFAHPNLTEIWARIGQRLVAPSAPTWERIFLTRRPGSFRTCHNAAEVEAIFESYGFEILRPEQFDLGVQAGFFRTAKVVAGFGGSQMFNLMYTEDLHNLIILNHEWFSARNEYLFAALLGGKLDWFWSVPEKRELHSDWTFDFDRNGAELEKLLASL